MVTAGLVRGVSVSGLFPRYWRASSLGRDGNYALRLKGYWNDCEDEVNDVYFCRVRW